MTRRTDLAPPALRRGIATVDDLRARSAIDPRTHCWHWQHARGPDGMPRIWTFDRRSGAKACLTGPMAAWQIAHDAPPTRGHLPYRVCGHRDCVNPAHLRLAANRAELGQHIARSGRLRGNSTEQRRANLVLARAAAGIVTTSTDVVDAIRAAPKHITSAELARDLGMWPQTVWRLRRAQPRIEVPT